ncbi:hypothetical protein KFK09_001214 [Dendrobium nobile]|uniref:Reverse transcriptase Ty1/copia-type domain-containing protein n=1 Tax=Dendrobium nobile TaxID=94219 RepID=A0A8T3CA83_DENNO|nr:hypothetical protein KFK09_001214 [Dendrobium nobile]
MQILIYVDDILLTGNSTIELTRLLSNLHERFQMRNLGSLAHFLGIEAATTYYGTLLHQHQYANLILERAEMQNIKLASTPISYKPVLTPISENKFSNPQLYWHLIKSLQYLTLTLPDIQFAVHQLSQHMANPLNSNFDTLKRILRYIQGTINIKIPLYKDDLTLQGFVDTD